MFDLATKLTADFLLNNYDHKTGLKGKTEEALFNDYYLNICLAIQECFYLKPTMAQIEEYILNGTYTHIDSLDNETDVICPVTVLADRQYLFRAAQSKQLIYDTLNGRANMIRGETMNLCKDSIGILKTLGLYQRTYCTI